MTVKLYDSPGPFLAKKKRKGKHILASSGLKKLVAEMKKLRNERRFFFF